MNEDEGALQDLLEDSRDVHSDAMRATEVQLAEFVDVQSELRATSPPDRDEVDDFTQRRDGFLREGLAGAGLAAGVGGAILALTQSVASAATPSDVQILQTAESIENLAVATYTVALTLPFIGGASANGVVKAFVTETKKQHVEHGAAFAAAIRKLNGTPQTKPDPVLLGVVNKAKPGLTSPEAVVALAIELEDGAAQTYVANTAALRNANARKVTASIMGVEAQHVAVLLAVQALLKANAASLIALPPSPLSSLPAAAGSVGFPHGFYPTSAARPETEGALSK